MVERMFVGEEKQSLERLKEEARVAKELQLTPVVSGVKEEPMEAEQDPEAIAAATAAAVEQAVNGLAEELKIPDEPKIPEEVKMPKVRKESEVRLRKLGRSLLASLQVAPLKFTRKDGECYKSEVRSDDYKDYREVRMGVDDMIKTNCHSTDNPMKQQQQQQQPYDEWEAIQRELALYPESRDNNEMVSATSLYFQPAKMLTPHVLPSEGLWNGWCGRRRRNRLRR